VLERKPFKLKDRASVAMLRKDLRRLGIRWPGDGDYAHGVAVYLVESSRVVRLVQQLDSPEPVVGEKRYLTEDRVVYVERKTNLGFTQEIRPWPAGTALYMQEHNPGISHQITKAVDRFIENAKQAPNLLYISFDDLAILAHERRSLVEHGDVWGLAIVLQERGRKLGVDRRAWS
jgi:hypothetical protein